VAASRDLQTVAPNVVASDLGQAVNDYFLGKVHPDASYLDETYIPGVGDVVWKQTPSYQAVDLPLWNKYSGPSYHDVAQGYNLADCWLLAGLAEVAAQNPGDIQSMFIDNGDQTYTVRFYNGSTPDYVTVDNYLPGPDPFGLQPYDRPQSYLWAALAEKAYVQENVNGWIGSPQPWVESYQALNDGYAKWALTAITGLPASRNDGYSGGVWWSFGGPSLSATVVANAWSQGEFVVLGTYSPPSDLVVPQHAYAVVGYSAGRFTLFNPWGTGGRSVNGHYYDAGLIEVDATGLADNFNSWDHTGAAAALAIPRANTPAGFTQTEFKPAMVWQDQIQTNLHNNTTGAFATDSESPVDRALLEALAATNNHRIVGLKTTAAVPGNDVTALEAQAHDLVTL
jgi:hypothetical protein